MQVIRRAAQAAVLAGITSAAIAGTATASADGSDRTDRGPARPAASAVAAKSVLKLPFGLKITFPFLSAICPAKPTPPITPPPSLRVPHRGSGLTELLSLFRSAETSA
jgi:hypothetical protein